MMNTHGVISFENDFIDFATGCALHDVIGELRLDLKSQLTYIDGNKRIDCIFLTEEIMKGVQSTWNTHFGYPFVTDHMGVYMNIPFKALLKSNCDRITLELHRRLTINVPKSFQEYIIILKAHHKHQKIFHKTILLEQQM